MSRRMWTVLRAHRLTWCYHQISYNMASDKVLNWLYSVLVNVSLPKQRNTHALTSTRNTLM
jgi:hypothetical protein